MKTLLLFLLCFVIIDVYSQDLSQGYSANDLNTYPMQDLTKPAYLEAVADSSFPNTMIRRISDAGTGNVIKPMYSTIQAWNADESLMIVYKKDFGHILLNGIDYSFIINLDDINPDDIEGIFWHFSNPNLFYYIDNTTYEFVSYAVDTQIKTSVVNLATVSGCAEFVSGGNDVQMMSWDSDVISFRCGNTAAYYYRISTGVTTQFNIGNINYTAPMPFPSGNLFFHNGNIYNASGNFVSTLNVNGTEHSCLGRLSNGNDAYFAISFEEGPQGGCQGTLVVHDATTGNCYSATPVAGYTYPQSGTHISSLAHKNIEGGWVAVSSMGFDLDGQDILDQELFIVKAGATSADVYRVAHHRSDETDFPYWGEPHVTMSPSGTRLLFGSDWSGTEDGDSVDAYIAELQAYTLSNLSDEINTTKVYPNPVTHVLNVSASDTNLPSAYRIHTLSGKLVADGYLNAKGKIDVGKLSSGMYFITLFNNKDRRTIKFLK